MSWQFRRDKRGYWWRCTWNHESLPMRAKRCLRNHPLVWIDRSPPGQVGPRMFSGLEWALPRGGEARIARDSSSLERPSTLERCVLVDSYPSSLAPGVAALHGIPASSLEDSRWGRALGAESGCLPLHLVWMGCLPFPVSLSPPSSLLPGITSWTHRLYIFLRLRVCLWGSWN